MALAMGQHPRLGALSRLQELDPGVLKMIMEQHELGIKLEREELEELKKKIDKLKLRRKKAMMKNRRLKLLIHMMT